jgi:hypothetical protein
MRLRFTVGTILLLLLTPIAMTAQQKTSGTFANMPGHAEEMELPNGQALRQAAYRMVAFADDPASPLHNISSHCTSANVVMGDGSSVSYSGYCFNMDAAGDGYSMWWQETEASTATCPAKCGRFGLYAGYGEFDGISGMGTWRVEAGLADGTVMGTWELSHKME